MLRNLFLASAVAGVAMAPGLPAGGRSLHDIPWYESHSAAREATIKLCRSDHRFAHDADCLNAETAEDRGWAKRTSANGHLPATPGEVLRSSQYWTDNPLARVGALAACRVPGSGYLPAECAAARQAEASARR